MASKVWTKSPTADGLMLYGQCMDGGCVFDVTTQDAHYLAFSSFLKLLLEYRAEETTCILIDMNAREVLIAATAGMPSPALLDVSSLFEFVKDQMKADESKTFCIVLNGLEETQELLDDMRSLLEAGCNVSICLVHSAGQEPSYSEALLHSFQQQINTDYYAISQYKM